MARPHQAETQKVFWSESLADITSVITTGEFWQRYISVDERISNIQPPSIKSINHILSQIRDVQFSGAPSALPIALETTDGELLVAKFEICLILDNVVKGSLKLLSRSHTRINLITMIEHLLDDPVRGVMVTDYNHNVLFVNTALCLKHDLTAASLLGSNITDIDLFQQDRAHIEAFKNVIAQSQKWHGAMITSSYQQQAMLETVTVKKIELQQQGCVYLYAFFGDSEIKRHQKAKSLYLSTDHVLDEATFRKKARHLAKQGGKHIVISFRPSFYSELEQESRDKVLNALSAFHDKNSFGYLGRNTFAVLIHIRSDDIEDLKTINTCTLKFFKGLKKYLDDHIINDIEDGQIGVALSGFNATNMDEVISQSAQAMFLHDKSKARINFYDDKLVRANIRRKRLEQLLIDALRRRAIDINFQPIVDTKSNQIIKLEALCRFRFEDFQYSVQEVIYLAEDLKVIARLDTMVAERAIEEFLQLIEATGNDTLSLSLNCSIADAKRAQCHLSEVYDLINRSAVDNSRVTIEITESAYFENNINNSNLIKKIRSAGIKIAVDDFGTGSSSFSYFSDFHFDELKIDKKFISNIHQVKQKYFAVNMLRQLSHDLNIKVVAEGVECQSELDTLKEMSVDYIQGFFFYKPMPVEQITQLLQELANGYKS
ncbi:EAL domain-containing protein [Vibrio hippocampi]|uniref:EAL domain-containing protein n=1 Tax=Vibrio hippocampi TaxID=654686 RepID=A0ABN8DET0_9VIBR|nr:EAL domain-containing protein [Vibrio hippocampi]CAH0525624.1 hypothetical protein VHP8226_01152 [Vibrio hippocampi]